MSQDNDTPIAEVLALAARYEAAGRLNDAERILETARSSQPGNIGVLDALASLARRRGDRDHAIRLLEEAATIAPDEPAVVGNLGNLYRASGALDRAIDCYRRVLEAMPESLAALNNLGLAFRAKGELDQAIAVYRRALAIDSSSAEVGSNLSVVLLETGAPDEAVAVLQNVLQGRPDHDEVRNHLGSALRALGRREEAIEVFKALIADAPEHAQAHNNLANALRDAGRLDAAIDAYRKALRLNPDNPTTLTNLAAAYAAAGQYDNAASAIARAKAGGGLTAPSLAGGPSFAGGPIQGEHDSDDPRAIEGLAYVHFLLGQDEEARRLYDGVLALDPDAASARHIMDVLSGRTTEAAPLRYVEALFDEYAPRFEQSLLEDLSYTGPAIVPEMLREHLGDGPLGSVLDLGCGTGLIGEAIRRDFAVDYLEGVDLSAKMVDLAEQKGVYDALSVGDLVAHLATGERRFNLVTAGDVLIYIGDLAPVFQGVRHRLQDGGHFLFTVEALEGKRDTLLRRSARYAHSLGYIDRLSKEIGFRRIACKPHDIRRDSGQPIAGYGVLLELDER